MTYPSHGSYGVKVLSRQRPASQQTSMAIDVVTSTSPDIAADPIGINHQRGYLQLALKLATVAARHVDQRRHLPLANNDRFVYYILPQLFRNGRTTSPAPKIKRGA